MADKNYYGNQEHIKVTPGITVTYNYNRLKNKPSINGKPLDGKMTASDRKTAIYKHYLSHCHSVTPSQKHTP